MLNTTIGKLVVEDALPEDMKDWAQLSFNKKTLSAFMSELAKRHPDEYRDVTHKLLQIARRGAMESGSNSFGLKHIRVSPMAKARRARLLKEVRAINDDDSLSDTQRNNKLIKTIAKVKEGFESELMEEAKAENSPLERMISSGARGNPGSLASLRGGDFQYVDSEGKALPVPITKSYGEGLDPVQYFAGSFGARQGLLSAKFQVAESGYFCLDSKTLVRMADRSSKMICEIKTGEFVLGSDFLGRTFPVRVKEVFENGNKECWEYEFRIGESRSETFKIISTPDHKVLGRTRCDGRKKGVNSWLSESKLLPLGKASLGFKLEGPSDFGRNTGESVHENRPAFHFVGKKYIGERPTYDIEVDHPDHLFVLESGAIVSNSKRLQQAAHRLLVTGIDEDDERDGETRGMPANSDDPYNEGSLLAYPAGGYAKNTILTPKILQDIKRKGIGRILVRSPIVGGARDGGLLARDVGVRESGDLPHPGSLVGLSAAQSIAERLSQGALSAKHLGGIAGKGVEQLTQGFPLAEMLVDIPKAFKGGATHAQTDGVVQLIHEAPAGGMYVTVNDQDHYIPVGHAVSVKRGDHIEAGDMLSSGIPNPSEIVKHKGIGEGRRYFTHQLAGVLQQAGVNAHRRNVELVARAMIDHVKMNDEFSDWLPGDVVSYQTLERNWHPREGFKQLEPKSAVGQYLEKPVLHYTVGTKIQPSMIKDMDEFGIKSLTVHENPPPFEPLMVRSEDSLHHDPDWISQMYGSGLKKNLLKGVHRGATSDEESTSFVPSLAKGVNFGVIEPFSKLNEKIGEEKQAIGLSTILGPARKIPGATYNYAVKPFSRDILAPAAVQGAEEYPFAGITQDYYVGDGNTPGNSGDWASRYLFQQGLGPGSKTELNDILNTPFSTPNYDVEDNVYVDPNANAITRAGQRLAEKGLVGGSYASALNNTAVNIAEAPLGILGQGTIDAAKETFVDPLFQSQAAKQYNDLHKQLALYSDRKDFQDRFHAAEGFASKYLDRERSHHDAMGQAWDADNGAGQSNLQKFRAIQAPIVAQYARGEIGPLQFQTALREAHQNNGLGYYRDVTTPGDFAALEQAAPNLKPDGGLYAKSLGETQSAFDREHQKQIAALSSPEGQRAMAAPSVQPPPNQASNPNLINSEFNKLTQQKGVVPQAVASQYSGLSLERLRNMQAVKQTPDPNLAAIINKKQIEQQRTTAEVEAKQQKEIEDFRQKNPANPYLRGQQIAAQFSIDHPELGFGGTREDETARMRESNRRFIAQHQFPKSTTQNQVVQKPAPSARDLGSAAAVSQVPKIPSPPKMNVSSPTGPLPLVPGGKS